MAGAVIIIITDPKTGEETEYVQTEYATVTPPIARRYERMSKQCGRTIVPVGRDGKTHDGQLPPSAEPDEAEDSEERPGFFGSAFGRNDGE